MSLADVISSAVEAVRSSTDGLQVQVAHEAWIGKPLTFGGPQQFADPVLIQGFVQEGLEHHKRSDGQVIITKASIAFLGPVAPNGAPERAEPIDPRDRITLPSGLTGHMVELPGVMTNPLTVAPYVRVIWLA